MPFILVYFAILEKLKCGLVYLQNKSFVHTLGNIYLDSIIRINFLLTFEYSPKQIQRQKLKTKGIRDMGLWDNAHTSG